MSEVSTKSESFIEMGVDLGGSYRFLWSIRKDDRVVVTVWKQYFDLPTMTYHFAARSAAGISRRGFKRFLEDLNHAWDHVDGYFFGVYAELHERENERPWIGKNHRPMKRVVFKLRARCNQDNGEFIADIFPLVEDEPTVVLARTAGGNELLFHPHGSGPFA